MTVSPWRSGEEPAGARAPARTLPETFPAPVLTRMATARSRRRRGSPSTAIGAPTRCGPIGLRGRWRYRERRAGRLDLAAEQQAPRRPAGKLPVAAGPLPRGRAARGPGCAASAGSRCTASAGTATCGGADGNAGWHTACVVAWRLWNAPSDYVRLLKRLQSRRCARRHAAVEDRGGRPPHALFRSGVSTGMSLGRLLAVQDFPTCRSSTGTFTPPSAPTRRPIARPPKPDRGARRRARGNCRSI